MSCEPYVLHLVSDAIYYFPSQYMTSCEMFMWANHGYDVQILTKIIDATPDTMLICFLRLIISYGLGVAYSVT